MNFTPLITATLLNYAQKFAISFTLNLTAPAALFLLFILISFYQSSSVFSVLQLIWFPKTNFSRLWDSSIWNSTLQTHSFYLPIKNEMCIIFTMIAVRARAWLLYIWSSIWIVKRNWRVFVNAADSSNSRIFLSRNCSHIVASDMAVMGSHIFYFEWINECMNHFSA